MVEAVQRQKKKKKGDSHQLTEGKSVREREGNRENRKREGHRPLTNKGQKNLKPKTRGEVYPPLVKKTVAPWKEGWEFIEQ